MQSIACQVTVKVAKLSNDFDSFKRIKLTMPLSMLGDLDILCDILNRNSYKTGSIYIEY